MLGVLLGFPVMIVLVGVGLLQLFELVPHSVSVLKILSVSYLLYLAWRIANTKSIGSGEKSSKPLRFIHAALFQWVNPKAWVMALTAISVHTPDARPLYSIFIVAFAFVISGTFSTCSWTLLGHQKGTRGSDHSKTLINIEYFTYNNQFMRLERVFGLQKGLERFNIGRQ